MALITLKGYVNQPATKEGSKGQFSTFSIGEKNKTKDGTVRRTFYNITNFHTPTPPEESSFVTVTGRLTVREYNGKDGSPKQSLDVYADSVEVAPPRDAAAPAAAAADPWDLG